MDSSDFYCPISRELMLDPVIASDGHTYERSMIAEWLRVRNTSPLTNERITTTLLPNITLKKVIENWEASQSEESQDTGVPMGVPVLSRQVSRGSPAGAHLDEVADGDELETVKRMVYSAYKSNDEVMLIRHVARISNDGLKGRFERCKRRIGGRTLRLFHGTLEHSATMPLGIASEGFKVPEQFERADDLQETGQLTFGKGIYFSERADLACAFGDATLVVADVALGREWEADQSLPHLDADQMREEGKDSVLFARTHEYACYDAEQALPLYLVTYRLVDSAAGIAETYDRATLEAAYERMTDTRSVDWPLVLRHVGEQGRPRQRHAALRKLGDLCRDDQAAMCASIPHPLLAALREQCLTLEAAEGDAPVTWLALRFCWNCAYQNTTMQRTIVERVGAATFTALLTHWNNDVIDRACGVILNLVQKSSSAREAFWAAGAPMALAKLVSQNASNLLDDGPEAGLGIEPVPHALGAIANLAFAEDTRAKFMRSTQLRTFLSTVAEPLMDSWAETVREEATRLFSCLISEGHAPKDWLEQGGAEVFQKSVSLNEHRAESSPVPTTEGEGGSGMTLMEMVEMLKTQCRASGSVSEVIKQSAEQLNVEAGHRPLVDVAEECVLVLGF